MQAPKWLPGRTVAEPYCGCRLANETKAWFDSAAWQMWDQLPWTGGCLTGPVCNLPPKTHKGLASHDLPKTAPLVSALSGKHDCAQWDKTTTTAPGAEPSYIGIRQEVREVD